MAEGVMTLVKIDLKVMKVRTGTYNMEFQTVEML